MQCMEFILHNGKIIRESEFNPGHFWWSNALQIKPELWFAHGEIPHFQEQMEKLDEMLSALQWPNPPVLKDRQELLRLIKRLINKNKAFMGGWVSCRFVFPGDTLHWVISVKPYPDRLFPLDPNGKTGVISPFAKPSGSPLNAYAFFSEPLWMAERVRSPQTLGIFVNDKGLTTEADYANLFFIRGDVLTTPAPDTGAVIDIMRDYVLRAAAGKGFRIRESAVSPEELTGAEEIFAVSEGSGFRWLMGIGGKRYMKTATELIWRQVNISCFSLKNIP